VSVTLDSELYARAKQLGINASRVAEEALAREVERQQAELLAAEIRRDLAACNAYTEKHGLFADLVRDHYRDTDEK
jgi:antitoxin CcdA